MSAEISWVFEAAVRPDEPANTGTGTPTRMSVYGEPSDELKTALTDFNPRYLGPMAGYARR